MEKNKKYKTIFIQIKKTIITKRIFHKMFLKIILINYLKIIRKNYL